MLEMSSGTYWDLKGILSEIRSNYNCMDEEEEPYYRALSEAIRIVAQPEKRTEERAKTHACDCIDRQAAISAICNACGKIDCDKMDKCKKLQLPPANCSEFPNNSDTISRQAAITEFSCCELTPDGGIDANYAIDFLKQLPSAQPKIEERKEESAQNVPKEDLISRKAVIDAIKGLPTWWADEGGYYGGAQPPMEALLDPEDAVSAIENLPSAEPEPQWIPCSERLPDAPLRETGNEEDFEWFESEQVLICDRFGLIHVANLVKDCIFNEIYWSATDDDELHGEEVKAWMPLPAPYKEGADD